MPPPRHDDTATVRSVFVIGPDKTVKLTLTYPASTGRGFGEILRVLDSLQLTAAHQVATPADWRPGEDVIITPGVSDEEAARTGPALAGPARTVARGTRRALLAWKAAVGRGGGNELPVRRSGAAPGLRVLTDECG